jgi:hypothetical protein
MTREQLVAQLEHPDPGARLGINERELAVALNCRRLGNARVVSRKSRRFRSSAGVYGYGCNQPAFEKDDAF